MSKVKESSEWPPNTYAGRKIRRYTEWQSMPYKEKSQYDDFQRIKKLSSTAGISKKIVEDALRYHKKISSLKTFRGINRDGVIAASIYIASRINGFPRTAKEIAAIFKLDNTAATRGCKNAVYLLNKIEKRVVDQKDAIATRREINVPISKVTASKRFKRMAKKIGLPKKETAEQWRHNKKLYPTLEHIKEGPKPIPRGFYDPGDGGEDLINKNLGKIYKTGGRKTRRRRKKKGKRKTKRKTKKRKKRKKKKTKKKSF
jgi:hypothetical protein